MVRFLLVSVLFVFCSGTLFAAPVAALTALEGEVSVLRSGVTIPSEKITEGFPLEPFDTITTGSTGRADVRLPSAIGIAGFLRMDSGTSLYLDLTGRKKEQVVGVELLTGAVSIRTSSVVGASVIEVRTQLGTYVGPGPTFRVVQIPEGDVLVTTSAGRVVCQGPQRTVFIEPGSVVQALNLEQSVQTLPMNVSTLDSFESTWVRQRQQSFRDQSALNFRTLASRYQLQCGLFQRAWARVQRESKDDDKGLRAATANLRRAAFPLERSLYQIRTLRGLLETGGLSPSLELNRGYPAKDFFRQAAQEEPGWFSLLGDARGLYKTLAERSGGSFPKASDGVIITWDSDFFH